MRSKKYAPKNYCLMIDGSLVRNSSDLPYRCSKAVAEANVKYYLSEGRKAEMLKIGKDIELGRE